MRCPSCKSKDTDTDKGALLRAGISGIYNHAKAAKFFFDFARDPDNQSWPWKCADCNTRFIRCGSCRKKSITGKLKMGDALPCPHCGDKIYIF